MSTRIKVIRQESERS